MRSNISKKDNSFSKYRPRAFLWFNRVLRWFYGSWLKLYYRMEGSGLEVFSNRKEPLVLISNHQSLLDPFLISAFVPRPIYWVTSDGNMRKRLMRFLLGMVGSIPKSKLIPDLVTVNWIVEVIRKRSGVVGIFAEGQSSWDGSTAEIIPSTAKMLKLLKAPVIVCRLKGAYYSLPRWSWHSRPGKINVEFTRIFDGPELKTMSAEDIFDRLSTAMAHDEAEWQKKEQIVFINRNKARNLELALFLCPECRTAGSMRSSGSLLFCQSCYFKTHISKHYRFRQISGKNGFGTIRDWSIWQEETWRKILESRTGENSTAIIMDDGVRLFKGRRMRALAGILKGRLKLYSDRLEMESPGESPIVFPLAKIEGEGVLKHQFFEFYMDRDLYQFSFSYRWQSALKWALAVNELKMRSKESI